jgi:hypothetical protein
MPKFLPTSLFNNLDSMKMMLPPLRWTILSSTLNLFSRIWDRHLLVRLLLEEHLLEEHLLEEHLLEEHLLEGDINLSKRPRKRTKRRN